MSSFENDNRMSFQSTILSPFVKNHPLWGLFLNFFQCYLIPKLNETIIDLVYYEPLVKIIINPIIYKFTID